MALPRVSKQVPVRGNGGRICARARAASVKAFATLTDKRVHGPCCVLKHYGAHRQGRSSGGLLCSPCRC